MVLVYIHTHYMNHQVRASEENGLAAATADTADIKQKNEGKWAFILRDMDDEPGGPHRGCVVLEVALPRHLDSSLVDVDVQPTWASLVIKTKVLRLKV